MEKPDAHHYYFHVLYRLILELVLCKLAANPSNAR